MGYAAGVALSGGGGRLQLALLDGFGCFFLCRFLGFLGFNLLFYLLVLFGVLALLVELLIDKFHRLAGLDDNLLFLVLLTIE